MARRTKPKKHEQPEEAVKQREAGPEEPERDPAAELEAVRAERDEYLARWQRAQADYQNMRRRELTQTDERTRRAMQPLFEKMLVVLDYLDMALASPSTNDESKNLAIGVRLTRDQFLQALEQEEIRPIPASETFDATLHEAKNTVVRDGAEPGTIVETVRTGYTWQGEVLRHAHVIVVAAAQENASAEPKEEEPDSPTEE